jgi:hypothetical protein
VRTAVDPASSLEPLRSAGLLVTELVVQECVHAVGRLALDGVAARRDLAVGDGLVDAG